MKSGPTLKNVKDKEMTNNWKPGCSTDFNMLHLSYLFLFHRFNRIGPPPQHKLSESMDLVRNGY